MHGVKSVVYQRYTRLEQVWVLAVALGLAVILGSWVAKRVIARSTHRGRHCCRYRHRNGLDE